jgi:hypothetical protein
VGRSGVGVQGVAISWVSGFGAVCCKGGAHAKCIPLMVLLIVCACFVVLDRLQRGPIVEVMASF